MSQHLDHILITGASGGLGTALAIAYAKNNIGITLSLFGRQAKVLQDVAASCRALGAKVVIYVLDIRNTEALVKLMLKIDIKHPLDLIIANAGIAVYLNHMNQLETVDDIRDSINTNLISAMVMVNSVLSRMRQRKHGQIAFISSIAAYHGLAISPSYCASKAGLKAYSEALRSLLHCDKIGVSVICPGFIESNMSQSFHGYKPFLLSSETAALKIMAGLKRNRACITFPYWLSLGTRLLGLLPQAVRDFCIRIVIAGLSDPLKF